MGERSQGLHQVATIILHGLHRLGLDARSCYYSKALLQISSFQEMLRAKIFCPALSFCSLHQAQSFLQGPWFGVSALASRCLLSIRRDLALSEFLFLLSVSSDTTVNVRSSYVIPLSSCFVAAIHISLRLS